MAAPRPAYLADNGHAGTEQVPGIATGSTNEAMALRGIRGATTVDANTRDAILQATTELLAALIEANGIQADDVASAFFTTTPDLTAEFPALAARRTFGWSDVALMCGHEMNVPGSLPMCLRILLHVNTDRRQSEVKFIYLRGATALRGEPKEQS
jgi:chorismate mutase